MLGVVLVTEAERTEQTMTLLIAALVVVAVLLALATVWYWRRTDPRRYGVVRPEYRRVDAGDAYNGLGNYLPGRQEPAPTGQHPSAHPGREHWPPASGRAAGTVHGRSQGGGWS
jgi:hypothetical protein